ARGQESGSAQHADSGGVTASVRSAVAVANAIARASGSMTRNVTPAYAASLLPEVDASSTARTRAPLATTTAASAGPSTATTDGSNAASTSTTEPWGGRKPSFGLTCTARLPRGTTASRPVRSAGARWPANNIAPRNTGT